MHRTIAATATAAVFLSTFIGVLHADIVQVGEFDSQQFEGFEGSEMVSFKTGEIDAFGGMATMFRAGQGSKKFKILDSAYRIDPYEGDRMFVSNKSSIGLRFENGQHSIGGFFAAKARRHEVEVQFFSGDERVGTGTLITPDDKSWAWNGWHSDQEFDRVEISSNNAYLMHDAIRVMGTEVPAPGGMALMLGGMLTIARRRR